MKKSVLIIEDNQTHYELVKEIFNKYEIEVCPSTPSEFKSLAKILREFGESKSDVSLEKIKQKIHEYEFQYIILDRSFSDRLDDKSGLIIEEKIFRIDYPKVEICYLSNFPKELNAENYIEKEDYISWESNLFNKVIIKLLEKKSEEIVANGEEESMKPSHYAFEIKQEIERMKARTALPKGIASLAERERFKFLPASSFLIDTFIKYLFYISLIILFVYAPVYLIWSLFQYRDDPIQIAEHAFIVFLPFLITCGFYVFYIKSLSPYIKQKPIDNDDFESSSKLMKLTKKLFVSSLLSYLFIILIELLALKGQIPPPIITFKKLYNPSSPLFQLYFVVGIILILILYYIYIDKNHDSKSKE